jgi:hypothetical protein
VSDALSQLIEPLVRRMQEPLGLDRWTIRVVAGPDPENTASCSAMPHYKQATISVDPDRLQTGDELDEIIAHELAHCHVWPIASMADDLLCALAEVLPEPYVGPFAKLFKNVVEDAEEATTTRVGHTYIRLLRKLWKAEEENKTLRGELKLLRKTLPG